MENSDWFRSLNAPWVRWSDYEIAEMNGVRYIRPVKAAEAISYNCAERLENLATDALNAGRSVWNEGSPERACLDFARRHGLLGLGVLATPAQKLFFSDGHAENSGASPLYRDVFSRDYGESLDRFAAKLAAGYAHFLATRGNALPAEEQEKLQTAWARGTAEEPDGLAFQLTFGEKPQLFWKPKNLLVVLRLAYARAVTDPTAPLKACKFCGSVYYNPNARSEFCSVTCRNHYNVNAFRRRKKDAENPDGGR